MLNTEHDIDIEKIQEKSDKYYSYDQDIDQMEEECSELILSLKRFKRGRNSESDVLEEMCDVQQLIDKFLRKEYFGNQLSFWMKERCKYFKMEALMDRGH